MNGEAPISRVRRTKAEAKASYDLMSGWYDLLAGSAEQKYKEAGLRQLDVRAGERVLEIGFGTGKCLTSLAQATGGAGVVYGIDLSAGMISVARKRMREAGVAYRVHLACGDAARLPFRDDFIDALFMSFTLELFDTPEIPLVLQECRRVLRGDGRLGVVAMAKKAPDSLMVRLYEWAHDKFTKYVDCRPIYAQAAVVEAGFEIESIREMSMFGLPVAVLRARKA